MKWYFAAPILLGLAACGTPQEQCIRSVSHDMIVLDRLIAETQGNIARGYGYQETIAYFPEVQDCSDWPTAARPNPMPRRCVEDVPTRVSKPVAIDLGAEQAKLISMERRRAEMARQLQPAIMSCRAQYPE